MSFAQIINRALDHVGVQIVRSNTLSRRTARPASAQTFDGSKDAGFWDLGNSLGLVRMRNGELVFIDTRDESLGTPICRDREWEPHIGSLIRQFLQPGATAVEVGSNIGCHVLTMARAVGHAGHVIAIEANPKVADLLRATVGLNGIRNARVIETAVLDRAREIELWASPSNLGGGAVALPAWNSDPNMEDWVHHKTQAVTLDSLTKDLSIVDLIHIDAEGCELAILAGAEGLLVRSPDVKIIAEWGAHHAPAYFDINDGLDLLINQGFRFWRIMPDASLVPQNKEQMLMRDFCDVLLSKSDPTPG